MHFERLKTTESSRYHKAMDLYKTSFPPHEQRETSSQAEIMTHEEYQFNLIYDESQFTGLLLCWETEDFIYVEHFCINPEMRNRSYGKRALELLNQRNKTVILEIDPPVDEISRRRKTFYERAGYVPNEFEHLHPPYHKEYDGHCLMVMSCPEPLTKVQYDSFNEYLIHVVMRTDPAKAKAKNTAGSAVNSPVIS